MPGEYQDFKHWSEVPEDVWRWPHFEVWEIACSHCKAVRIVPDALDKLEAARLLYGRPISLVSAYRCKEHPIEAAKSTGPGSHETGTAFDPYPSGEGGDLAEMEDAFFTVGVMGRGKGIKEGKMHIHFDFDAVRGKRSWGY